MTVKEVVAKIARGEVYLIPITFREGLTIRDMATLFESKAWVAPLIFHRSPPMRS